jgi:Sec-independent protein translocase protein TatA
MIVQAFGPVDWNSATRFIIEVFSLLALFVILLIGFLRQLPELAREWRKARRAFRRPSGDDPDDSQRAIRHD